MMMLQMNSQNVHRLNLEQCLGPTNLENLLENTFILNSIEQYQQAAAYYLEKYPEEVITRPRSKSSSTAVTDSSTYSASLRASHDSMERVDRYGFETEHLKPSMSYMTEQPQPFMMIPEKVVYQVQFKHNFRDYMVQPGDSLRISMGSFVVVKCDYGEDIGVVTDMVPLTTYVANKRARKFPSLDSEEDTIGIILRIASLAQRQTLPAKLKKEGKVMKSVLRLVHEVYKLPMKIIGVEYQADLLKLTIHYVADVHIDFRELVKELFALYRVRIWMKKCNQATIFSPKKFAVLSLTTGTSHEDNWEKHMY